MACGIFPDRDQTCVRCIGRISQEARTLGIWNWVPASFTTGVLGAAEKPERAETRAAEGREQMAREALSVAWEP